MPQIDGQEPISYSLVPYAGPWTQAEAAHLLRRTLLGPTLSQINDAVANGMVSTVSSLLQIPPLSNPITFSSEDNDSAVGSTWVNSVYTGTQTQIDDTITTRYLSLVAWLMERANTSNSTISEKICLFWHNHFAVSLNLDPRTMYDYFALINSHALGNFKQLVKDMTIDPAMLLFLNGATNVNANPNENYSRELLELFSIGKGPQLGPGDYTNYTEHDVSEGAKVLTGYFPFGLLSDTETSVSSVFIPGNHDGSVKTLSEKFNNAQINPNGANEYGDYIDVIFQQDEVAKHICRKLYRWFVNFDLTATVESTVIDEMSSTMIANNYDILPVLQELFTSEHFYDISVRGAQIKSPMDMIFSMFNSTETGSPSYGLETDAMMYASIYHYCGTIGQTILEPPSVAGWPAYYQEPAYSQLWINATYLQSRFQVTDYMCILGISEGGENWRLNVIEFLNNLTTPADPIQVIEDLILLFTPKGASAAEKLILKGILTNGQPDFEWTQQYNEYLLDPNNPATYGPIRTRLELTLARIFHLPQFQTF